MCPSTPQHCQYHLFNKAEMEGCLRNRSIGLIGDSVLKGHAEALQGSVPGAKIKFWELLPFRLGRAGVGGG